MKLTVELPESIFRHLKQIAEQTHQPLETLAVQSITGNLPPSVDNAPPEIQADLLAMQQLAIDDLRQIAQSQLPPAQQQRYLDLLEKRQVASLPPAESQELSDLRLAADQLTLRKAYAWNLLRWRGQRLPA
ncbi:MAG: hypothetical protein H6633_31985 [Anaerolineales bacterium]|nr:hypothetical protein [Anaerolineales bacterium]